MPPRAAHARSARLPRVSVDRRPSSPEAASVALLWLRASICAGASSEEAESRKPSHVADRRRREKMAEARRLYAAVYRRQGSPASLASVRRLSSVAG